MIVSIIVGAVIWYGWSLYRSRRSQKFEWKQLPKTPIAVMAAVISYLTTPNVHSYMELIGTSDYFPFSYPLLLSYTGSSYLGEWDIGFIVSNLGFSLKEPSYIPFSTLLIISVVFFLINYTGTILTLNYFSSKIVKKVSNNEISGLKPEIEGKIFNHQENSLAGCVISYCFFIGIVFTSAILLMIRSALESEGELLYIRDIINYVVGPSTFLIMIIAPLIGSIIIVHKTKTLKIGIMSMKYFFIPIIYLGVEMQIDALLDWIFNPVTGSFDRMIQGMGFFAFSFVLIWVLVSRSLAKKLLIKLVPKNYSIPVDK